MSWDGRQLTQLTKAGYVLTNSRGDVEALYAGDGSLRARYIYDSWGNTISMQDGNRQGLPAQSTLRT